MFVGGRQWRQKIKMTLHEDVLTWWYDDMMTKSFADDWPDDHMVDNRYISFSKYQLVYLLQKSCLQWWMLLVHILAWSVVQWLPSKMSTSPWLASRYSTEYLWSVPRLWCTLPLCCPLLQGKPKSMVHGTVHHCSILRNKQLTTSGGVLLL